MASVIVLLYSAMVIATATGALPVTPVPGAHIGSAVTLWGEGLPIDDVAHAAGTIGYELMCALAARVQVVER